MESGSNDVDRGHHSHKGNFVQIPDAITHRIVFPFKRDP